jgi:adenosylcobinamide kinase/adenosylcobinamide-phosphate guanylyltransferase
MAQITLLTGGARSGKSSRALERAMKYENRAFIATAIAVDEEMRERIEHHQQQRQGEFETIEEPRDLAGALIRLDKDIDVAVIDCMTVWVGNLMHEGAVGPFDEIDTFIEALDIVHCDLIIVTNEVGMSVVPATPLGRKFRDVLGDLNRRVAEKASSVALMVCGQEVRIKGSRDEGRLEAGGTAD